GRFWSRRQPTRREGHVSRSTLAGFDRIVKQQAIAAPHHLDTVRDQAAGFILAGVVLEILLGAAKAEQDFGDGAIALATQPGVKRAQRQDMPLPKLGGNGPEIRTGRTTVKGSPKTADSVSA